MEAYEKVWESIEWLEGEYREMEKWKSIKKGVILGRKFSMGARFQYELAKNLFEESKKKGFTVLVDYPISIPNDGPGRKQTLYPDILVISKNKLVAMMEVKMDPGWMRSNETLNKSLKNYNKIFKKGFSYKISRGTREERAEEVSVPNSCQRIFIIVSEQNHRNRLPGIKDVLEKNKFELLVLLRETHPNGNSMDKIKAELPKRKKKINEVLCPILKRKQRKRT